MAETKGNELALLQAEIARLKAENEALAKKTAFKVAHRVAVSPKGAVMIFGFGKWPVTLYAKAWLSIFEMAEEVKAFIEANKEKLSWEKATE